MTYRYCLGGDNRIAWVSDEWIGFARENSAPELTRERVVGKSVFAFISGAETEYLYYLLLDEIRTRRVKLAVPFRCDGPSVRRYMRLEMWPLDGEGVAFEGSVVREEAREAVSFLDAAAARSAEALTICSWCKTIQVGEEWLEVEAAVERLALFHRSRLPQQNHAVCPTCSSGFRNLASRSAAGQASETRGA